MKKIRAAEIIASVPEHAVEVQEYEVEQFLHSLSLGAESASALWVRLLVQAVQQQQNEIAALRAALERLTTKRGAHNE